jgi:hypothetical protein
MRLLPSRSNVVTQRGCDDGSASAVVQSQTLDDLTWPPGVQHKEASETLVLRPREHPMYSETPRLFETVESIQFVDARPAGSVKEFLTNAGRKTRAFDHHNTEPFQCSFLLFLIRQPSKQSLNA